MVGLDEAYVDLSGSPVPQSRAREIKARIKDATRLVCSIGLAPNKLMAKIASDLDKPDGLFVLTEENWLRRRSASKPASLLPGRRPEDLRAPAGDRASRPSPSSPAPTRAPCERTFGPHHGAGLRDRGQRHRRRAR